MGRGDDSAPLDRLTLEYACHLLWLEHAADRDAAVEAVRYEGVRQQAVRFESLGGFYPQLETDLQVAAKTLREWLANGKPDVNSGGRLHRYYQQVKSFEKLVGALEGSNGDAQSFFYPAYRFASAEIHPSMEVVRQGLVEAGGNKPVGGSWQPAPLLLTCAMAIDSMASWCRLGGDASSTLGQINRWVESWG